MQIGVTREDLASLVIEQEASFGTLRLQIQSRKESVVRNHAVRGYVCKGFASEGAFITLYMLIESGDHVFSLLGKSSEAQFAKLEPVFRDSMASFLLKK